MYLAEPTVPLARIVEIVQTWPGLTRMGASVARCEARKIRPTYEGGLELEYRLVLLDAGSGDPFNVTVLGKISPNGAGESEYATLRETLGASEHLFSAANLNGLLVYEPDLRLLLHCPLMDEKLPALATALDTEAMKPFLARFLDHGALGPESIRACAVETLRYKPGKRCTLRYRLEVAAGEDDRIEQRSFVGKIYGDGQQGESIYATMVALDECGFGRDAADGITIPHPYGYLNELQMLLLQDVGGTPLKQRLSEPALAEHLQAAARALVKIHCCSLKVTRSYAVEERLATLERGVTRAARAYPDLAERLEESLGRVAAAAADLRCPDPVLVHRDFQYNQILLESEPAGRRSSPDRLPAVTIVDFDTLCHGDPALDLGNFLGHLRWQGFLLAWPEEEMQRHAGAFLASYEEAALGGGCSVLGGDRHALPSKPSPLASSIDFYYRASLLRIACLVSLRPARRHLAAALLEELQAPTKWATVACHDAAADPAADPWE